MNKKKLRLNFILECKYDDYEDELAKNVLVNDVKHINVIQTKNSTYGSSENVDLNDKQSNDDRQLDSRKEPMLEVSTVQYLSNNTESGIYNYSDSSSNETIKKGDAVNKKDAKVWLNVLDIKWT